jgi:hypothetical protein
MLWGEGWASDVGSAPGEQRYGHNNDIKLDRGPKSATRREKGGR